MCLRGVPQACFVFMEGILNLNSYAHEIAKARYFWPEENSWEQLADRICVENAKNEKTNQEHWHKEFMSIIQPMDFIPAGRILRNLGKLKPSTSNCNFLPIDDSIESIAETLKNYLIISSYGGGNGINFSSLRPKGTPLVTKGGTSSGMVSFIEMFNNAGSRLETGGQRRAAGIALCNISHPEIEDFIDAKIKHDKLNQFNISVIIDSNFLKAVERDDDWQLRFAGKIYKTIKAKSLWHKILDNMLKHAEPGLINWDKMQKNNTFYFSPIGGCNPCGELPLEEYGVCNLGSIVLPHFVTNVNTDWQKLARAIQIAVRFMDNIIDLAFYPLPQQETIVKNARRIGIGTMGLADYLFKKKIRYGSEKSIQEIEKLYKFIRDEAYKASIELAKEKGAFPKYDKVNYCSASFIRKLPPKLRLMIKENAIRNATLLTCPPTGTTALLANVISGIEPLPFKGYKRADGVGERIYISPYYRIAKNEDWFVDSYDLTPEEHLEVQATIQKYIDSSVSKTILLPSQTQVKDLDKILMEYIYDLKGITIYRDTSRGKQVYYRLSEEEIEKYGEKEGVLDRLAEEDMACKGGMCEI